MENEQLCLCKRDVMSICTGASESKQKKCIFYKKSTMSDRCMYFMFDEYCDCLEAQTSTERQDAPEIL